MNMNPDRSDYELWFTDWLDGKLSQEQAEAFLAFLKQNPDLAGELNDLELVSLEPPEITFSGKDISRSLRSKAYLNSTCLKSIQNSHAR